MLPYEHQVVGFLLATDDPTRRRAVVDHVAATLAAMPEHLRAGIAGETVLLTTWSAARRRGRPIDPADELGWLDHHPIGLVRQWVRALRSLVLFAEHEMSDVDHATRELAGDADHATRKPASDPAPAR